MKKIWIFFILIFVLDGCANKSKVPEINIEDELRQYTTYPDFVYGCLWPLFDAVENIGYELKELDEDSLYEKAWLSRVLSQVAIVNAYCDAIIDYDEKLISENYKYAHSLLLISVKGYKDSMLILVEILSERNISKLPEFEDSMWSATDYFLEAIDLIKKEDPNQ